ncbi:hypothetical protein [Mesorhizobium sp. WSM4904]|uniref:hypothetical protein n=1 Tax=Mesorhizobium sp. WSM4904 TaxID=3038545 RepID=UPI00241857B5|nr:hypothetical protein [Mesorhizobium sp. WSM4904]WFP60468.1 hypothetical protein QAZ47_18305 [Mesorhizobium sp. WSM4904]
MIATRFRCMSPKSAQRFWENDTHQNRDLRRVTRIRFCAARLMVSRISVLAPGPLFRYSQDAKVNVMDTRTLLILGLGIVILLLLGFFALPA